MSEDSRNGRGGTFCRLFICRAAVLSCKETRSRMRDDVSDALMRAQESRV
jgi:hypothetical protein